MGLVGLVAAGCFERGGKKRPPAARDAGAAPAAVTPAPSALARDPSGAPDPDATITIRLEAEPVHLDPFLTADAVTARVALGDIYEGLLLQVTPTAEPTLGLASAVDVDPTRTRWSFTIRDGVTWHDGKPLTPDDVVFTYRMLLSGSAGPPSWLAADFGDLREVTASGHTVTLTFAGFRPGRREALARVPILPRHVFPADPAEMLTAPANRAPVGTGPLRWVSWQAGQGIELERYGGYWGTPARAAHIRYRVVTSREQVVAGLLDGTLDLAPRLPVDEAVSVAEAHSELALFASPQPAYLAAVYNLRRSALADVRVRRALTMLLDRPSLVTQIFHGYARVISGPFLPGGDREDAGLRPLPFDPAAAARLLEQARSGAGGAAIALTVLTPAGSRTMARIADIWAADAAPYLTLTVAPLAYADLLARVREGRFDIALLAFTTGRDVDLYTRFHSAEIGGENYGGVSDPELDRALEGFRSEPDPAVRRGWQQRIARRLHQLQPYTFIVSDSRVGLVRRDIGGVGPAGGGAARLLWRAR